MMNAADKFALCLQMAQRIVQAYREEAPEGCDPQNSWVAVGTTAVSAIATGVSAYQSNKNAKKAAGGGGGGKALKPPKFKEFDVNALAQTARAGDAEAYGLSDQDFKMRHSGIVDAEKLFEASVLRDQQGESELSPAMQSEFVRAGLAKSLDAFGGQSSVLAPGSAGEAAVARNLGVSIMDFQDRNRRNRERSLAMAQDIFPRRQIGMTGKDRVGITMSNVTNKNSWNQQNWLAKIGQYNAEMKARNEAAAASAASDAAMTKAITEGITSVASSAAGAYGRSSAGTTGTPGPYGSTYTGSYAGKPVYRPAAA